MLKRAMMKRAILMRKQLFLESQCSALEVEVVRIKAGA